MKDNRWNNKKENKNTEKENVIIIEEDNAFYELDVECLQRKEKEKNKYGVK